MNFNTPHRQYVQAGGQASCVRALCMSFPARSEGIIKPLWRHGPKVALSPLRRQASRESGFYRTCLGLSQRWACRPRSISCLGKGCSCCRGKIAVVGNPAAPLWRRVNSRKMWTINWPNQIAHCRNSGTAHWCHWGFSALWWYSFQHQQWKWKRAGIFCVAFSVIIQNHGTPSILHINVSLLITRSRFQPVKTVERSLLWLVRELS